MGFLHVEWPWILAVDDEIVYVFIFWKLEHALGFVEGGLVGKDFFVGFEESFEADFCGSEVDFVDGFDGFAFFFDIRRLSFFSLFIGFF